MDNRKLNVNEIESLIQNNQNCFQDLDLRSEFLNQSVLLNPKRYYEAKFGSVKYISDFQMPYNIPYISHDIWVTNPNAPKQIKEHNIKFLKKKISILDQDYQPWQHILWVNCKECIAETILALNDTNILVKEVYEDQNLAEAHTYLKKIIEKEYYGIAKDFLMPKILEFYGGFYSDINFILFKSPSDLMMKLDFIVQTSPYYNFSLFPSMVASIRAHPIIKNTIKSIIENVDRFLGTQENNQDCGKPFITMDVAFTPFLTSFYKYSNIETKDIAYNTFANEVEMKLREGRVQNEVIKKIMLDDYDLSHFGCVDDDKNLEMFYFQFDHVEINIPNITIGVDIGEGSWLV